MWTTSWALGKCNRIPFSRFASRSVIYANPTDRLPFSHLCWTIHSLAHVLQAMKIKWHRNRHKKSKNKRRLDWRREGGNPWLAPLWNTSKIQDTRWMMKPPKWSTRYQGIHRKLPVSFMWQQQNQWQSGCQIRRCTYRKVLSNHFGFLGHDPRMLVKTYFTLDRDLWRVTRSSWSVWITLFSRLLPNTNDQQSAYLCFSKPHRKHYFQ